jgi:leader peptidase (prepilin peptidase)/N-methyltransferase
MMHELTIIHWVFALLMAAILGSFGNVLIHRLPRMILLEADDLPKIPLNLSRPASHCPQCLTPLRWWQNLPLVSFVLLRGKCAECRAAISWRYFIVEFGAVFIGALCLLQWGWSWSGLFYFLFLYALWVVSWIDARHYLLPDLITLPLLAMGLLYHFCFSPSAQLYDAILAAFLGYVLLRLVYHIHYALTKREGLGFGDMKLFAAIGAWLGLMALPTVLLSACLLALVWGLVARVFRSRSPLIPLGPFLSFGAVIGLFYPQWLLSLMGGLYG